MSLCRNGAQAVEILSGFVGFSVDGFVGGESLRTTTLPCCGAHPDPRIRARAQWLSAGEHHGYRKGRTWNLALDESSPLRSRVISHRLGGGLCGYGPRVGGSGMWQGYSSPWSKPRAEPHRFWEGFSGVASSKPRELPHNPVDLSFPMREWPVKFVKPNCAKPSHRKANSRCFAP